MNARLIKVSGVVAAVFVGVVIQIVFTQPDYAQTRPKTQEIIKKLETLKPEFPTWRPVKGGKTIAELRKISQAYGMIKIKRESVMAYGEFEKKFMGGDSTPNLDPKRQLLVIEGAGKPFGRNMIYIEHPETTVAMDAKTGQLVHRVVSLEESPP